MKKKSFKIYFLRRLSYLLLVFVIIAIVFGFYRCPFNALFKIPCPTCGMTRACKAVLRLDFSSAIRYHCLFPLPILWAIYQIFRKKFHLKAKTEQLLLAITCAMFLIRWLIVIIYKFY